MDLVKSRILAASLETSAYSPWLGVGCAMKTVGRVEEIETLVSRGVVANET